MAQRLALYCVLVGWWMLVPPPVSLLLLLICPGGGGTLCTPEHRDRIEPYLA